MAIWYVQMEDGDLKYIPALITPDGPSEDDDGGWDSIRSGDDVKSDGKIFPGPNGLIDTSTQKGDDDKFMDARPTDALNLLVAPGTPEKGAPTNYSQRGKNDLWTTSDGEARLNWFDGTSIGVPLALEWEYRVGPVLNLNTREMHIDAERLYAEPGDEIRLYGHFTPERPTASEPLREVRITRGGARVATLTKRLPGVTLWNCGEVRLRLPGDLDYGEYEMYAYDPSTRTRSNEVTLNVRERLNASDWIGEYYGRIDGRAARLSIEQGFEMSYDVVLRDLEKGVTFRGGASASTTNELRDFILRSPGGETKRIHDLLLHNGSDHISGSTEWRGKNFGLAFGKDASLWERSEGRSLDTSFHTRWSPQWEGTYDGYLDGREVRLTISDGETSRAFGDSGPLRYVYQLELEDLEEGVTYTGEGIVRLDRPHVMLDRGPLTGVLGVLTGEVVTEGGVYLGETELRKTLLLEKLLLHTWDTNYITGYVYSEEEPTGTGMVGAYFIRREEGVPPYLRAAVDLYNENAGRAPDSVKNLLGNERINLRVTRTTYVWDRRTTVEEVVSPKSVTGREEGEMVEVLRYRTPERLQQKDSVTYGLVTENGRIEEFEKGEVSGHTMNVTIREGQLRALLGSEDPGELFLKYYWTGGIELRPVGIKSRIAIGTAGVASNLISRFRGKDISYPNPEVERLAGLKPAGLSPSAGLITKGSTRKIPKNTRVSDHFKDLKELEDTMARGSMGAIDKWRMMKGGTGVAGAVSPSD